ncbi:PAR3 [Oopsacas minuta]|uniref:PAR3 n=1 Tax=Oopsacas minuta TaxID=111878 RepID=A0A2P1GIY8_9METZ|nr:PAR3 [Oopsacas minuta]KAI6652114.1 PAR3 [Oopsacas minuta]
MNTLDKYRVTVCFFLEHNSSKNMRILVPCQDSWTINRLKDEALRRLRKNLTPSSSETDADGTQRLDDINVKHIENLSKDILDGDDIIRDVLDNKEILVARLEGDQDVDFFQNDYFFRGNRANSIAGDSVHSTLLTSGHGYPESIHLPIRAETEIGTPERYPAFCHHSYYTQDRRQSNLQYPVHDDFNGEVHPPPRSFAPSYLQNTATDYEMPRIQPRYSYSRPDSCNSDIPHTSDSSNFMTTVHSRSPSVLSEENRACQPSMPPPYHSHTFSNPEHNYPSNDTSPLVGITSGDSGFSTNSAIPPPLNVQSPESHSKAIHTLSLPLTESDNNWPTAVPNNPEIISPNVSEDKLDSPSLSPPPLPFGRKYRPSVMHGYINPEPQHLQEINPILEENSVEEPSPHQTLTKTDSTDRKTSPKVTLRLITRVRSIPKDHNLSLPRTDSPLSISLATNKNNSNAPVDTRNEYTNTLDNNTLVQEDPSNVEVRTLPLVTPPIQQPEHHIDKVIESAIELPEERPIATNTLETYDNSCTEDSPALPQKRAKTSASPPPAPVMPLIDSIPINGSPLPLLKLEKSESNHYTPSPTMTQPDKPEEQSPDVTKPPSMVGVTRGIGAIFSIELEKGPGGLGFGIKSRDTAADGMTYPHFVSSLKTGGVAQLDGHLKVGDLLLEVNGTDVTSLTHILCLDYMRKQRGRVKLKVSRQDKSRQAGDPDGGSYTEARIDDDRREEEATMDLVVTPQVVEVLKETISEEEKTAVKEVDTTEQSINSIGISNTSLDEISPLQSRESLVDVGSKQEIKKATSTQNLLKQAALTDTTIYTPRGKKIQPLLIPLTETGLGVSVRGKTRMNTNSKPQEGGIFVKVIVQGGAADKDGRLKPNDQILSINGCVLVGQSNQEAMKTLKYGLEKISPEQPVIKLVVLKKPSVSARSGKRPQRPQDYLYARKLSLSSKSSIPTGYANSPQTLPSIYHPICMEDLPKNGEGRVFSVLDTHPELETSRDKTSESPPPDYGSLTQGHIYEQLDASKKRGKKGGLSPTDMSKFRTAIQRSTDSHEEEHIYARPQRRNTEEGIYTRPNRVVYGRITATSKSKSTDSSIPRTPTYSEEIYAQPTREDKSKRKGESIYEAPLMVKPKYGEGVFKRKPKEHLYECVTDIFEPECKEETMDTSNDLFALRRPQSLTLNNPYGSIESNPTPTEHKNREHPTLSTASKSASLQKTPSGDTLQTLYPTGRSTPRGPRNLTSRAVPHAPISSTKRPRSRTGRIQYPSPIDLSPYFTSVHPQLLSTGKQDRIPVPLTEPPIRSPLANSDIYKTTIREVSQGSTPVSTPHRPHPHSPPIGTPFEQLSPVDLTFASEQDDSLGPVEFKRNAQGRDDVSERHPFAKDAKQLTAYKDIQFKIAEEKLKAMNQDSPAQKDSHPMSLLTESGNNIHIPLGTSASTPVTDKNRDKLTAAKRGSFFSMFRKKKGTNRDKNLRDTPSPLLDAFPPTADDLRTFTDMVPHDDD